MLGRNLATAEDRLQVMRMFHGNDKVDVWEDP